MDNKPMRVLQTGLTSNPGGVESFIMNVYRHIDRKKIQFDFLIKHGTQIAYEEEVTKLGGRIFPVYYGRKENIWKHYRQIKSLLTENNFCAIHMNLCFFNDIDILKIGNQLGINKRIVHSHNSDFLERVPKYTEKLIDWNKKRSETYVTDYLACSSVAGKWMFGEREFKVINNGIDISKYAYNPSIREQKRLELGLKPEHFVIGVVGRIQYQKNPEFIVEIFKKIYEKEKNAVLLWVGDGDLRPQIEQKIMEYGLNQNVKLFGMRKDVNEIYQTMDVFLLPSRFEGLPVVGIEAQASGLPCFFSGNIIKEAKITNLVNYISIQKTAGFWAEQILRTKNDHKRKDQTETIRNAGYDIKTIIKELEKIYLEIK
ncbi:glycosyltransferase family 1 protein [Eubacterium maltosivorans]|uniref:Glycosyltransferase family 1 protein n=1 Tax=Eubacterium maltosivorans TaxID=2041044 RepID=A0A4P9C693_EUBML|nr:glycosyltransferase family 1 protein [Eubacterium maltosivorans]QCT70191.1 glycosyltransferase family 1 protein [Eubacterium maltosivorans]